jgi:cytochrome o ubiquinol oxidase subunit 2
MGIKFKIALAVLLFLALSALVWLYIASHDIPVLDPKGWVAAQQKSLLISSTLLMLIVVVPALLLTLVFAWRYREGNKKAKYTPDWDHSHLAEVLWWGVPCVIIAVLGVMTWFSTYQLNPFKPIDSDKKAITIQAVALQWKWLFIYPEQGIATLNFVQFPEKTPVRFEITADAPMNSFWIPALGGQIYAMPGMKTALHLIADEEGVYRGSSANISGKGFAGMSFQARSLSDEGFTSWVKSVKKGSGALEYKALVPPSQYQPPASYVLREKDLFNQILMKYMQ